MCIGPREHFTYSQKWAKFVANLALHRMVLLFIKKAHDFFFYISNVDFIPGFESSFNHTSRHEVF